MTPLERRVRAACCPFHGFTPSEYERHVQRIVRVIERAKGGHRG